MMMSPSPTTLDSPPQTHSRRKSKGKSVTLADHISNERLRDRDTEEHHLRHHGQNKKSTTTTTTTTSDFSRLRKQKSCREFNSSENNTIISRSTSPRYSFSENSAVKKASCRNHDIVPRRLSLDENTFSSDNNNSRTVKKLVNQKVTQRANSLTGYKSSKSQWALSPGRSGSPPMSVELSKDRPFSFSSLRPQNKGVDKILSMGFDFFRSKKSSTTTSSLAIHHLRLLNNMFLQWRFANCRAQAVNDHISRQAERNLIYALDGLTKLQRSVLQKKIRLERERLEMKLNFVLHYQMRLLEAWRKMESEHLAAIAVTKECLHSVVCKVPLLEGAKVDIQLASVAQRHATDLTASIMSLLSSFSPSVDKTAELLSELTKVIAQEKLLLKEINNLLRNICVLELKERSLQCSLIQLKC